MLHFGARARLVMTIGATCTLAACASIYGIDAPDIVDDGGVGDDGSDGTSIDSSTDGTVVGEGATDGSATDARDGDATSADGAADSTADGSTDGGADAMDSAIVVPDASVCGAVPDPSVGVFVAPNGLDGTACGSSTSPCLTIQKGIMQANGRPNVYVATGTYAEAITLIAGITVWGGWTIEAGDGGDAWSGICAPSNPVGSVIIQPTMNNITVTASALGGAAVLKTLTLESKPQANVAPGESLYGVFATGSTTLTLDNVDITLGNGGDGSPGSMAGAGAEGEPVCNSGDGGPGTPTGSDGGGAEAGAFAATGYQPSAGEIGGNGEPGASGRVDDAGTCVSCVNCAVPVLYCTSTATTPSCGDAGGSGCGGGGGYGGGAGGGGGSSIAIYVWGATVTVAGGKITAGNGGQGAAGGSGGPGGPGGTGTTGNSGTQCVTNCNIGGLQLLSCPSPTMGEGQGSIGTTGGTGSRGGWGGAGAGGWACAIYEGADASVQYSVSTALNRGNYGTSPAGGALGKSGDTCP
jgi:hypothetical protein